VRAVHVVGPQRRGQPVARIVGDPHRIVDVVVFDDADDRPEHLVARDAHLRRYLTENRRFDEPAARVGEDQNAAATACSATASRFAT
jgi:hypothetical protein